MLFVTGCNQNYQNGAVRNQLMDVGRGGVFVWGDSESVDV
jgi:hypothetical protein